MLEAEADFDLRLSEALLQVDKGRITTKVSTLTKTLGLVNGITPFSDCASQGLLELWRLTWFDLQGSFVKLRRERFSLRPTPTPLDSPPLR